MIFLSAPTPSEKRLLPLDALRGIALLGVLLVNLLTFFRVSLLTQIVTPHTHPGTANYLVDLLLEVLLEFKAFTIFSLLFGVSVAMLSERLPRRFLIRRMIALLVIGACHLFFVSNVDILTLYAICGLLLLPVVAQRVSVLAGLGFLCLGVALLPVFNGLIPSVEALRAQGASATTTYAIGTFAELLRFRWEETRHFIFPLLLGVFPKTLGTMLVGMAAWKAGVVADPQKHALRLRQVLWGAGLPGALLTVLGTWSHETGRELPWGDLRYIASVVSLAMGYSAGLLLWLSGPKSGWLLPRLAALGQLSLSNYLAQSLVFSAIFYGFGLGYLGKLGSATALWIGIALYLIQLITSTLWLRHFRFGPAEWFWRSLTYGTRIR